MKRRPKKEVPAAILTLRDQIKTQAQADKAGTWLRNLAHFIEANHAKIGPRFRARLFRSPRPAGAKGCPVGERCDGSCRQ